MLFKKLYIEKLLQREKIFNFLKFQKNWHLKNKMQKNYRFLIELNENILKKNNFKKKMKNIKEYKLAKKTI